MIRVELVFEQARPMSALSKLAVIDRTIMIDYIEAPVDLHYRRSAIAHLSGLGHICNATPECSQL